MAIGSRLVPVVGNGLSDDTLRGGWVSTAGPLIARSEVQWAREIGRSRAIALRSQAAAYDAVFETAQIGPGDEVLLPALAPLEAALAVLRRGAVPLLADVDGLSWGLDAAAAAAQLTARTRALVIVHHYGHPCDVAAFAALAQRSGLLVIEDCGGGGSAAALRGPDGTPAQPCGSCGDRVLLTISGSRRAQSAGAGMILLDDTAAASALRDWRDRSDERRMTNLQASFALDQVTRQAQLTARRRRLAELYRQRLADCPALTIAAEAPWAYHSRHEIVLQVDTASGLTALHLHQRLAAHGIDTRLPDPPLYQQPALRRSGCSGGATFPRAEQLSRTALLLPSGPTVSDDLVDYLADVLAQVAVEAGR